MEIKIKIPGGIELEWRREPMDKQRLEMNQKRFEMVFYLLLACIIGSGIIKFFSLVVRG